jgi:hypothetical protein
MVDSAYLTDEHRGFPQRADREAQVLQDPFDSNPGPSLPLQFLGELDASILTFRRKLSFFSGEIAALKIVFERRQAGTDSSLQLFLCPASPKEAVEFIKKTAKR